MLDLICNIYNYKLFKEIYRINQQLLIVFLKHWTRSFQIIEDGLQTARSARTLSLWKQA